MATPTDIDPAVMKQLQAQGYLAGYPAAVPIGGSYVDKSGPGVPVDFGAADSLAALKARPTPTPGVPNDVGTGATPTGGIPAVQPPPPPQAPATKPIQGDFVEKPTGAAAAWRPNMSMTATPAHATSNVSPETRARLEGALVQEKEAGQQLGAAEAAGDERQAAAIDRQAEQLGATMREQQIAQKDRSMALDGQMKYYQQLQQEAAEGKVNPDQWWGSKSGANKALGVIGLILGALGGGATGGRNMAVEAANKFIDRDIEIQKANIANKHRAAEAAGSLYAQNLQRFKDQGAADLATRAAMQEQFKLQLMSEAAHSGSQIKLAQAKMAAAGISLEQAKLHQALETWHQSGVAGGITKEDSARAAEFVKKGYPPQQALQLAMSLRGVAPNEGLPAVKGAGGKVGPEEAAATALASGETPKALSFGERIENAAAGLPLVGRAFEGTAGARKAQAIEAAAVPVRGYAHKVLGARTPEAQEEMAHALIPKVGDSQARLDQKKNLQRLVAQGVIDAHTASGIIDHFEKEEGEE